MKRSITIAASLAAAVALTLALAGVASANGGPHGGYGASAKSAAAIGTWSDTDKCAACHRAHTGLNADLLVEADPDQLCQDCHGGGAAGAKTQVMQGVWTGAALGNGGDPAKPLNGGGFNNAAHYTGAVPVPVLAANASWDTTTSKHAIGQSGPAYGSPVSGTPASPVTGKLECVSCHNPHGNNNYRILNGSSAYVSAINPVTGRAYGAMPVQWLYDATIGAGLPTAAGQVSLPPQVDNQIASPEINNTADYSNKFYTAGLATNYDRGISDFCATCHTNYLRGQTGHQPERDALGNPIGDSYDFKLSGTPDTVWRHPVSSKKFWENIGGVWQQVTPPGPDATVQGYKSHPALTGSYPGVGTVNYHLRGVDLDATVATKTAGAAPSNGTYFTCLTCHFAHGSSAQMSNYALNSTPGAPNPTMDFLTQKGTNPTDSALLFLDGRGVCQNCHGKPSN